MPSVSKCKPCSSASSSTDQGNVCKTHGSGWSGGGGKGRAWHHFDPFKGQNNALYSIILAARFHYRCGSPSLAPCRAPRHGEEERKEPINIWKADWEGKSDLSAYISQGSLWSLETSPLSFLKKRQSFLFCQELCPKRRSGETMFITLSG